ncbi:hypothetical protein [Nocardia sp. CNY236]|uniref:hypothetical protein n=1 Tax=Nocardia sp. CNY236 TaxID=1169152 RepID=UPI00040B2A07|nr:hypothetical protein [Nocardia sp. CNY236]
MSTLVRIGLLELAFGALMGWPVAAGVAAPQLLQRLGVRSPRRLLQTHLDFVIMGVILIAVGLAVPDLPTWIAATIVVGTLLNPLLFLPLAFREQWADTVVYRSVSVGSFLATSVGLTAAAFS